MLDELYGEYNAVDILDIEVEEFGKVTIPKFHWARVQNQGQYPVRINNHILYPMAYPTNVDVQREMLFPVIPFHTYKENSIDLEFVPVSISKKIGIIDLEPYELKKTITPKIIIQFAPNVYTKPFKQN